MEMWLCIFEEYLESLQIGSLEWAIYENYVLFINRT